MTADGGPVEAPRRTWVECVMGLPVSVTVRGAGARGEHADRVVRGVFGELRAVDRVFSTYRATSEISLLRRGALPAALTSPLVREVLALCEQARVLTGGHFDAEIIRGEGRVLDPSGLVKGWAVERASRALAALPGSDWLINAGGDVLGRAQHGPAWQIAVQDPQDRARVLCVLPLTSGAIATSGTAARGHHLLDPTTGRPVVTSLVSSTVVGPSLTWADVLATGAFVEGPSSLSRIAALAGYEAMLVTTTGRLHGTTGLATSVAA